MLQMYCSLWRLIVLNLSPSPTSACLLQGVFVSNCVLPKNLNIDSALAQFGLSSFVIPQSVLRRVPSLFQSEFPAQWNLVFLLSIYSTLSCFLRLFSSCLHFLSRLPETSNLPSISLSIPRFTRQFLHKMWTIRFAFVLFVACRKFLSFLTLCR